MSAIVDVVALSVIVIFTFSGYKKGLVGTAIAFASSFLSIPLAGIVSAAVTETVSSLFISFVVLLILFKIAFTVLGYSLKFVKKIPIIKSVNAVGGLFFGFLNGIFLTVILYYCSLGILQLINISSINKSMFEDSYFSRYLLTIISEFFQFINFRTETINETLLQM